MDKLRNTVAYYKKLRNNEIDHGDILAFRLAAIMSKTFLWWTDEDYKEAPKWKQVIYLFFTIRLTQCMSISLVYLGMHWETKPLSLLLNDIVINMTGLVGSTACFVFPYNRKRTSNLLRTVNEINRDILMRKHNALQNQRTSNRLILGLSLWCTVFEILACTAAILTHTVEFALTGLPSFNSFFYQPLPYSLVALVDEISIVFVCVWALSLNTLYLSMYFEFILRISFYFRVTAEEMRQLRKGDNFDEDEELRKLKSLIKDLNLLYWCVDEFNYTLRIYMIHFVFNAFVTTGIFAAAIMSMDSIMESLQWLVLPIYLFLLTTAYCAIGQHLKDSAGEVHDGIYDCDWYNAPVPFRKLVLNVLTRCTREVIFTANPFYDLDLNLLFRVLKTTYSVVAVFAKAMKQA